MGSVSSRGLPSSPHLGAKTSLVNHSDSAAGSPSPTFFEEGWRETGLLCVALADLAWNFVYRPAGLLIYRDLSESGSQGVHYHVTGFSLWQNPSASQGCGGFFRFIYFILCMSVLLAYMFGHHVHTWCLWRPEEN